MGQLVKAGTTRWRMLAPVGLVVMLAACKTPFSNRLTEIDWAGSPAAGKITVSQPKMYRRESLINERRNDAEWIGAMLRNFSSITFQPEMYRELEQITTFAAAIGLNFDPARGAQYQRETETGAIQHRIDVLNLQLQLDQLTRDAELVRSRFAAQTEPSGDKTGGGDKTGTSGDGGGTLQGSGGGSQLEAAVTQLKAAVDRFNQSLETRLGATAADIKSAQGTVNPSDLFRDQLAHRDLLKAALNSANLDDLHDFNGSALIRLNFQAMALPEREGRRAPGIVQMTIAPPAGNAPEWDALYRHWLDHINRRLNRATDEGWEQDVGLLALSDADLFALIVFYFPRKSAPPEAGNAAAAECKGYAIRSAELDANCAKLVFAVPKFIGGSDQEGAYSLLEDYLRNFQLGDGGQEKSAMPPDIHRKILAVAAGMVGNCALPGEVSLRSGAPDGARFDAADVLDAIRLAQLRVAAGDEIARAEREALRAGGGAAQLLHWTRASRLIAAQTAQARFVLSTFEDIAYRSCPVAARRAFRRSLPRPYRPPLFEDLVSERPRIAVYEIGPRELVQQVSSVSRIANSLSLALSLAAAKPGTGLGATAAGNYSRQAIGKAATFERIPSLIGYAARNDTFGWVIMPKAVFDPAGNIVLEQGPRTMDLAVDLSVPVWWPYFELVTATGWGPAAPAVDGAATRLKVSARMPVQMKPNYADFEQLTFKLQRDAQLQVRFDDPTFKGQSVSACRTTTLYARGAHLWRASAAVIGGHRLEESAMAVTPDMSGVLLTVPALSGLVTTEGAAPLALSVFTRDGQATGSVSYAATPPGGCVPVPPPAARTAPEQAKSNSKE